jgi:hypothetical protein
MRKLKSKWVLAAGITLTLAGVLLATVTTIPDSALISSTTLYTDQIGGGIGSVALAANDDSSTSAINLGFTLNFFGNNYTQFYINNNGNVTFQNSLGSYTPTGPQGASQPIISPFFADVDTRGTGSGLVYLRTDIANQLIVTWSQTGYFSAHTDKLDNFQLVLRGPAYNVPTGEGQVGFFYTNMQWEVGDASGGAGGFCTAGNVGVSCFPAAIGFGDGNSNGVTLAGSLANGIAAIAQNHHIWFSLAGGIPTVPGGPTTVPALSDLGLVLLGVMLFGLAMYMKRGESATV